MNTTYIVYSKIYIFTYITAPEVQIYIMITRTNNNKAVKCETLQLAFNKIPPQLSLAGQRKYDVLSKNVSNSQYPKEVSK